MLHVNHAWEPHVNLDSFTVNATLHEKCSYRELHEMLHFSPKRATKVKFFTPWYLIFIGGQNMDSLSWKKGTKAITFNCSRSFSIKFTIATVFFPAYTEQPSEKDQKRSWLLSCGYYLCYNRAYWRCNYTFDRMSTQCYRPEVALPEVPSLNTTRQAPSSVPSGN